LEIIETTEINFWWLKNPWYLQPNYRASPAPAGFLLFMATQKIQIFDTTLRDAGLQAKPAGEANHCPPVGGAGR
jgi:hypothetical protein